jgi:hypothetical protein
VEAAEVVAVVAEVDAVAGRVEGEAEAHFAVFQDPATPDSRSDPLVGSLVVEVVDELGVEGAGALARAARSISHLPPSSPSEALQRTSPSPLLFPKRPARS